MASFFSIRLLPFEQPIHRVVQLRLLDVVQLQFVGQTVLGRFALHAGEVGELESGGCERGIRRGPLQTADQVIDEMLPHLLDDLPYERGDQVAVLVNGLGATPKEELYILFRRMSQILKDRGITIFDTRLGEYATSMEMAGASVSLLRLDDELKRLLCRPARKPFFEQVQW